MTRQSPGHRISRSDALRLLGAGALAVVCVLALHLARPQLYVRIENAVYDTLLRHAAVRPPHPAPVIIAIDDESLVRYGQWPWPRRYLAGLIGGLRAANATLVALDLVLPARDRTSPMSIQQNLLQDLGLRVPLDIPPDYLDNDRVLSRELQSQPSVLGYKFLFEPLQYSGRLCQTHPFLPFLPPSEGLSFHTARDVICNLSGLTAAAVSSGFVNALPDADGVLRRVPMLIRHEESLYPNLMLATVMALKKNIPLGLGRDADGAFLTLGRQRVHVDGRSEMLLRFRGPQGTFHTISAVDIMEGQAPDLSGRLALIGATSTGLGDSHVTPPDRMFPGVEVHATILDNLLQGDILMRPVWAGGAEVALTVCVGILTVAIMVFRGPASCLGWLLAAGVGVWLVCWRLLAIHGYWTSPLPAELTLALTAAGLSLFKYTLKERELLLRNVQLVQAQDAAILSLTALAETRDPETGGHIKRTREYIRILAEKMALNPRYSDRLDQETIDLLYKSAPLHDIGKVGVRDHILLKPGSLDAEERREMHAHAVLGFETLDQAEQQAFDHNDSSFLAMAKQIAYAHHEKWDGTGYPQGLKGEEIPLGGRLMAVADVYDALVSKRVYKEPVPHARAVEIIVEGRGRHFDPDVVDAFLESEGLFKEVFERHRS